MSPADALIESELPAKYLALFPAALRRAYTAADALIAVTPFLGTPGAKAQRGDLIAHAADFEVMKLVQTKALPYDFSWEDFARPTGKHLVVRTPKALLTVHQLAEPVKPRNAIYRSNYAANNQVYMFEEMNREEDLKQLPHLILGHGYQDLTFAWVGVPRHNEPGYAARTANLLTAVRTVESDLTPAERTPEADPELLDSLQKVIRDGKP